ncbi:MAG: hypothetical protein IJZ89_00175 [Clostridia bacterium]|nr:hypothetical protein [Clostridia bacterium]
MKKFLALILAAIMLFAVVSCGNTNNEGQDTDTDTNAVVDTNDTAEGTDTEASDTEDTSADTEADAEGSDAAYSSAVSLLETIWATYGDDEKFFIGGGNTYNADTMTMDAPGTFVALADTDYDENLGYPAADVAKLDDAASMFHGMNVNTFTCSAFHFTNGDDASAMVDTIKENIKNRQWICGFPEKLVIISVPGDYLLVMWGVGEGAVDTFVAKTTAAIEGAAVLVDEALA